MNAWFKDWFSSEEYLEVYKHRDEEDAEKLLTLILKNTNLQPSSKVVDAACGAGRHSIYLHEKGLNVVGFDLSRTLLKKAQEESIKKNIKLNLFCADLRKTCLKKNFDLVVNLFTSFGYFESDEENFAFPKASYRMLNDKGFYILDYLNRDFIVKTLVPQSVKYVNGKKIIELRKIDRERIVKEIIINNDEIERSFFESVKLYKKDKIINEFEKIGFKLFKVFGDYIGSEFDIHNSSRLILFFRK
jgi:cyclopropane fatty-acyl-phospholipid synthase-like methyltransferase